MKKRTLAALLILVMLLSLMPLSALAVSDADNGDWSAKPSPCGIPPRRS